MRNQRIAFLILATFLILPYTTMVEGVETNDFVYRGSTVTESSLELELQSDDLYKDYFAVDYPAVNVSAVSFDISPEKYNGSFVEDLTLNDKNRTAAEWGYTGTGYGAFGLQTQFNDGHSSQSLSLMNSDEKITLKLPVDATDLQATVDISGRPSGSEDLEDGLEASVSSDQGSYSYHPNIAVDGSGNAHVVWVDNGDLDATGDTSYDIFYNRWEGSGWSGIQQLTPTGTSISGTPFPSIVADGSNIFVVWEGYRIVNSSYRYTVDFIHSDDGGDSWSTLMNLESEKSSSPDYPTVQAEGSDVYVVWQDYGSFGGGNATPNIIFRHSDDGGDSWGNPKMVSDDVRDGYSYQPRTYLADTTLYVVWYDSGDYDGEGDSDYDIVLRSTDDDGSSWATTSLVSTSDQYSYYPQVAADTSGNVHVVWEERGEFSNEIHYRKSSNGGVSWGTESTLSDSDSDYNPVYPAVDVDGTDLYVAWQQQDADDTTIYQVKLIYSSNGGTSFGSEQFVHLDGYSRIRDRVQLNIDSSDNIWATWGDEMQMRWHEGSGWLGNERDVWVRQADRGAASLEDPLVASEHQYEGQSYQPLVEVDEEGNFYMLYWDSGDVGGNGNSYHSRGDGDYFFTSSSDGGQSWSEPFVVTDWERDATSYYYYYYKADMAVGPGGMVYTAWYEYDYNYTDSSYYKILFRSSADYGKTWDDVTTLDYGTSSFYFPNLAVDGDNVYYSARKYDGSYYLNFKYSTDKGDSWSSGENLFDFTSSSSAYEITMDADNGNVVLGWEYTSGVIYYTVSTDGGESFGGEEQLPSDDYDYDPMLALEGSSIYFTWRGYEDSNDGYISTLFMRSTDLGDNWDELVKVSNNTDRSVGSYPAIDCQDGLIYIAYYQSDPKTSQYAIYLVFSDDHGVNWEPPVIISNEQDDDYIYSSFPVGIAVGGQTLFAWNYYLREQGISHYQIWTRVTKGTGYPEDPELSIQGSGNKWTYSGELNRDNSPQTWDDNFADALEDALTWAKQDPDARTFIDQYGVQMTNVTISGSSSDSEGRLLLNNLEIEYDIALNVQNKALLEVFQDDQEAAERDGRDMVQTKLIVMGTAQGGAFISNLRVITADVDLELEDLTVSGTKEEGNDLELSVYISNKASSDIAASATVTFWKDTSSGASYGLGKGVDSVDVEKEDLPNDGSRFEVTGTWEDVPSGSWYLFATITASSPEDELDTDNQQSQSVSITQLFSDVSIQEITFDPAPIEGQETEVTLELANNGDKSGYADLEVYVDKTTGDDIFNGSGIEVRVDDPTLVRFTWTVEPADKFIILWAVDGEEMDDHEEQLVGDLQVMTLPYFELDDIVWEPTSISDNTVVNFSMTWDYQSDIPVTATVALELTQKSQPDKMSSIYFHTDTFEGRGLQTIDEDKKFEQAKLPFSNFYAEYTLRASITNIQPVDNDLFGGAWDPDDEAFMFENDEHTLTVASPPEIEVTGIYVDDELEAGNEATVEVTMTNFGESTATGKLKLFTKLEGTIVESLQASVDFEIPGDGGSHSFDIMYDISETLDGTFTFIVRAEDILPAEGGSNPELDNEEKYEGVVIHGKVVTNPEGSSDSNTTIIFVIVGLLGVVMLGGGFFIMRSMKSKDEQADDPALMAPAAPGVPASPAAATGAPMAPPAAAPAYPGAPAAPPPPPPAAPGAPAAPAAPGAAGAAGAAAVQAVTIKCPTCQTSLKITSAQRPITVACPSCSTKLKLET